MQVSPATVQSWFEPQPRNVSVGEHTGSASAGHIPWFEPDETGTQSDWSPSTEVSSRHAFGWFGCVPAGVQKHFLPLAPRQLGLDALSVIVSVPLDPASAMVSAETKLAGGQSRLVSPNAGIGERPLMSHASP